MVLLLFYFLFSPNLFNDKISFLLSCLSLIIGVFILLTRKVLERFYINFNLKNYVYFSMIIILFFCFFVDSFIYFYLAFEFSVIPIFFYIIFWGRSFEKIMAGLYLFFYTYISSMFFLVMLISFRTSFGAFDFSLMILFDQSFNVNIITKLNFFLIIVVFLIKIPVFMFHIWLPLAHVESPLIGSMVLAGVILKLGGYGLIRLMESFFYNLYEMKSYFLFWGCWGAIMTGFICFDQIDLKKIVAFASVSHITLILCSVFRINFIGKWGSVAIMLGHGIRSSALFLGLGVLYYRFFTRNVILLGSVILVIPLFGLWWFIFCIMNISFPPFIGFIRELTIFLRIVNLDNIFVIFGIFVIMVTSIYTIMIMVYLISGLEEKFDLGEELTVGEHLNLFIHRFFLFLFIFGYWII